MPWFALPLLDLTNTSPAIRPYLEDVAAPSITSPGYPWDGQEPWQPHRRRNRRAYIDSCA